MKHTDFSRRISEIRFDAVSELKAALYAHSGKVALDWENKACVAAFDGGDFVDHYEIHSISFDDRGNLSVYGKDLSSGEFGKPDFRTISLESIQTLISAIPETKKVSDVSSIGSIPVVYVDNDDLAVHGYPEQDKETLEKIAGIMSDHFLDSAFYDAMDEACKSLGIEAEG